LLGRNYRRLPINRIKKVSLQQSALQRVLGVASISMATVAAQEPEVALEVVDLKTAVAMEILISGNNRTDADAVRSELILKMPLDDVIRLGTISPKSFAILALTALAFFPSRPDRYIPAAQALFDDTLKPMGAVVAAIVLVVALLLASRLVSVAMALLQYHGFRLSKTGPLFTVERGLLTRWRTHVSQHRIQKLTMHEGPMHRWLKRRSVKAVTTEPPGLHRLFRSLAPLAPAPVCESLIGAVFPGSRWSSMAWNKPHASIAPRLFLPLVALISPAIMAIGWATENWKLPALLLCAVAGWLAWKQAGYAGYAFDGDVIAVRDGYWFKRWRIARLDRLQALALSRSPMDRLFGTSTLQLDIPSNQAWARAFSIRFLPERDASHLFDRIGSLLPKKKLRRETGLCQQRIQASAGKSAG
jgi:putative membrane protein